MVEEEVVVVGGIKWKHTRVRYFTAIVWIFQTRWCTQNELQDWEHVVKELKARALVAVKGDGTMR